MQLEPVAHLNLQHAATLLAQMGEGLLALDHQGTVTFVNPAAEQLLGWTRDEMLGKNIHEQLHIDGPGDSGEPAVDCPILEVLQSATPHHGEDVFTRKDGAAFPVGYTASPVTADGRVEGVVVVFREIGERKRLEEVRRQSEERFRALVQNAFEVIIVVDAEGINRFISPSIERVLGYGAEDLVGNTGFGFIHPDDRERSASFFARILAGPGTVGSIELRVRHRDTSWRYIEVTSTNMVDVPGVNGIVSNVRDITERRVFAEQLEHQAFHDALTNLPNRALFMDRLRHALAGVERNAHSIAVLFLDLDRFKVINDSLGHDMGDQLLVAVANRLQACIRPGDTVARLGGDEFTILLEHIVSEDDAIRVAERILEQLKSAFTLEGRQFFVTTSIGIAISASRADRPEELLREADLAMYRAKHKGRARYEIFDEGMNARARQRLEEESGLRRALEHSEFKVYYQPKVVLASGDIMGFEALVRWEDPQRGIVSPADFIGLAEETGLILPLGRWVLEEACRQAKQWQEQYPRHAPWTVWVNVSARQFAQAGLVADVARALEQNRLAPQALYIEITESVLMDDTEATTRTLQELKALGINLAIDDFGTGYSSLSYLKNIPFDMLKIDRSFVAGLGQDQKDTAIVQAVITLANTLGKKVTAEGVETCEQVAHLKALNCLLGQGYIFAKPLPAENIDYLLEKGACEIEG